MPVGWLINGEHFTGTIATVGSGKTYANLQAALAAVTDNTLLLVDAGSFTYATAMTAITDKRVYIRGLGAAPTATMVTCNAGTVLLGVNGTSTVIVENMKLLNTWGYGPDPNARTVFSLVGQVNVTANRCELSTSLSDLSPGFVIRNHTTSLAPNGAVVITNCKLLGKYHLTGYNAIYLDLSKVRLSKVELSTVLSYTGYVTGTLAENDTVTTPTNGYGHSYGTNIITYGAYNIINTITIYPTTVRVLKGTRQQLLAIATYTTGRTEDLTALATWSSSDNAVATVSNTGLVTAKSAGTVTITASYTDGSTYTGTRTITVGSTVIPLKAIYTGATPTGIGELTSSDKIGSVHLPVDTDATLLSDSDELIPTQKAVKAYVNNTLRFPPRVILPGEILSVGDRQECVLQSGTLDNQGTISIGENAVLFIGTGIN